jgi:hypothetical protein
MDSGGFASTLSDAVYHYHSVFDSETWQEVYGDPGFVKHVRTTSLMSPFYADLPTSASRCEELGFANAPPV